MMLKKDDVHNKTSNETVLLTVSSQDPERSYSPVTKRHCHSQMTKNTTMSFSFTPLCCKEITLMKACVHGVWGHPALA